jgi:exopolysaccharide biosynthesis operon protein EpsL
MVNNLTIQVKRHQTTRHVVSAIAGTCLFVSQQAVATLFDVIQPYVATQLTYDSNVIRLPTGFTPDLSGNHTNPASFIKQVSAGLAVKWQFSQQEITADVSVNKNLYSNFRELDYTGHTFLGQWNWRATSKLKGELSYSNRLAMGNFSQINRLILDNLENREIYLAGGRYEFIQDWFLRAQFTRSSLRYAALERQASDLLEISQEYGIRYLNVRENMLGFRVIMTDGKYTTRSDSYAISSGLDNGYTRMTYDLEGKWNYSVKTRFRADIGYLSQEYKHIKSRNFSNIVGRGDILWEATKKLSFFLEVWREVSSADTLTASFILANGVALTPKWTWSETPKIQVELPISYIQQDSLGTIVQGSSSTLPATKSNLSDVRLNLNYTPIPNIEMIAFVAYQNRSSNNPLRSYTDEMVGLTVKASF